MKTYKLSLMVMAITLGLGSCMKENLPSGSVSADQAQYAPPSTNNSINQNSAIGAGVMKFNGAYLNYNFTAMKSPDGFASGTLETFTPDRSNYLQGLIADLNVTDSVATMSVRIIKASPGNPWSVSAKDFIFLRVKDNSKTADTRPDQVTDLYFTGQTQWNVADNEAFRYYAFHDVIGGNVRVHDIMNR